jgi:hypothetical protein
MRINPSTRFYLRLIALSFAMGVMFQAGLGVASHFTPRVNEIHIIQQPGAEAPARSRF